MMMGQSLASVFLALVACASLCCRVLSQPEERQSDGITLEREEIFVEFRNGTTFSVLMEPDDTVLILYQDINEYEGVPWSRMQLRLNDTCLDDLAKLSDINIRAGTTVTLVMPEDQGRYVTNFIVRTRDGRKLPVAAPLGNTVASLKDNITQWTGIPFEQQRLLFMGKELKDERKLVHYGIDNGTKIDLGRPLEDCRREVTISVLTLSGATIEIEVNLADTVSGLKERIWEKTGVPAGVQRLSADGRTITGENRLCDIGLKTGTIVYMFLYSSRITSPDQVARLREQPVARPDDPHKAPIFREVEDLAGRMRDAHRPASHYKDARNWIARDGPRPCWESSMFDPIAHLEPNPDSGEGIERNRRILELRSRENVDEANRLDDVILGARTKLSAAIRPYRVAANLTSIYCSRQHPGLTLGGGFTDVSSGRPVPLGADVNNWAPDAFSDSDLMRLFELGARVRRLLARAAHTGEGILGIASQRRINRAILFTYLEAIAGYQPSVEYAQARENEECGICRDDLTAEPASKLACRHAFHTDCLHSWAANSYEEERFPGCPSCRQRFMFPYEALGKAELETHELLVNQEGDAFDGNGELLS